jgi:hypothetical protein
MIWFGFTGTSPVLDGCASPWSAVQALLSVLTSKQKRKKKEEELSGILVVYEFLLSY